MDFTFDREPIAGKPVSVIIPVNGAAAELPALLETTHKVLASLKRPSEILVVHEGAGAAAVEQLRGRIPELKGIVSEAGSGEGGAVAAGLAAAAYPLVFLLPADCGVAPSVLPKFLEKIDEVDIVAGVRKGLSRWDRFRTGGSGWWLYGVTLTDVACPVRLYRRSLFADWPLQAKSGYVHIEIAAKANFCGALMAEAEVEALPAPAAPAGGDGAWADLRRVFLNPKFRYRAPEQPATTPAAAAAGHTPAPAKTRDIAEALPHHPDTLRGD